MPGEAVARHRLDLSALTEPSWRSPARRSVAQEADSRRCQLKYRSAQPTRSVQTRDRTHDSGSEMAGTARLLGRTRSAAPARPPRRRDTSLRTRDQGASQILPAPFGHRPSSTLRRTRAAPVTSSAVAAMTWSAAGALPSIRSSGSPDALFKACDLTSTSRAAPSSWETSRRPRTSP